MTPLRTQVHRAIVRYSQGELSAREAAEELGDGATVHDVVFQLRSAGLPLPRLPQAIERADLARAKAILNRHR